MASYNSPMGKKIEQVLTKNVMILKETFQLGKPSIGKTSYAALREPHFSPASF
jgi:hypothetical protein